MSLTRLFLHELAFRRGNLLITALAILIAGALFVSLPSLVDGYHRQTITLLDSEWAKTSDTLAQMDAETTRLMRDMGFNLLIVHRDTDMADFWSSDFSVVDMPQEYVERLANARELTLVTHLVATLQARIRWDGRSVLLVGYLPETPQAHAMKKSPMGYAIEPGTVLVGQELGAHLAAGDSIEISGRQFRVARILEEQGSKEDIMLAVHLDDAQAILDKPGRINEILALGCRCAGERLPKIREQLASVLPDTKITEFRSIAVARAEQRDQVAASAESILAAMQASREEAGRLMRWFTAIATPLVVTACGAWVAFLAILQVRARRAEIGLLRTVGIGRLPIAALFLVKALLVGFVGGGAGALLGGAVAMGAGPLVLGGSAELFRPTLSLTLAALVGGGLLAAIASYLPVLTAVLAGPNELFREA